MATVNFSVPDDVKQAFNEAFRGQNKLRRRQRPVTGGEVRKARAIGRP